jgi:N-acetylmuramoyl-L-alanine amidase
VRFKRLLFLLFTLVCVSAGAGNGFAIKTVVIDAGHGGKDPGAIGPGKTNEKDVALAVALKLGEYIHANFPDVNVIYTRKTDVFIELHERAEIANKNKADLFIAIHCNSTPTPTAYGTSTYVLGLHRTEANLEVAKRENSVILLEDDRDKNYEFDPNSPEGHIMMSMKQNAFLDQSIDMASKIEGQYEGGAKRKSLGVKQAGFYVLYKTAMPSILSEIGFISNPTEEKFLASEKGQEMIAASLFKAFKDYKFEMENSEGEQFAYEEAKKKAAASVDTAPVVKKQAPVAETVKTTEPAVKEVKPAAVSAPVTTEKDNAYVTTQSGRKIRKPIDNASGGGIAPVAVKQAENPPVKTETKKLANDEVVSSVSNGEPKTTEVSSSDLKSTDDLPVAPDKTTSKQKPDTVKPEPVKSSEVAESKPAAEGKKVEAGNSGGAVIEAKPEPVKKPAPKPEITETKPAARVPVTTKNDDKPTTSVKPVKKSADADVTTKHVAKTEDEGAAGVMTFKVQLIALKGAMKSSEVTKVTKALGAISNETIPDKDLIRYYAGNSKTYAEARKKLAIAVETGYKDAFIVGFKDEKRYGPEKLKAYQNQ